MVCKISEFELGFPIWEVRYRAPDTFRQNFWTRPDYSISFFFADAVLLSAATKFIQWDENPIDILWLLSLKDY